MKTFHYIPGAQSPEEFNEELAQFCADNDIVDVDAKCIGSTLWLSLSSAEDLPVAPLLISPSIMTFSPAELSHINRRVEEACVAIENMGTDESPAFPIKALPVIPEDFGSRVSVGYMLLITCVGAADDGTQPADPGDQS